MPPPPYYLQRPESQQFLTPELIAELARTGTIPEEQRLLDEQMHQAQALRQPGPTHSTGLGGAFGAAADMLNAWSAKQKTDETNAQRKALLQALQGTGAKYGNAVQQSYGQGQSPELSPGVQSEGQGGLPEASRTGGAPYYLQRPPAQNNPFGFGLPYGNG